MTNDDIKFKNRRLYIEGLAAEELARKFGTPLYCYSAGAIERNFRAYDDAMSKVMARQDYTICYAAKANSNIAVLRLLKNLGAGADIVSGGEMLRALKSGVPPSKIVYSGVGKSEAELEAAIKKGLYQINVEAEPELEMIARIAQRLKKKTTVSIRINPNVDAKTHAKITTGKKENKFGIDIELAPALYRRALKMPYVHAAGVAVHIGSQLTSLAPFKKAYARVASLVRILRKQGNDITRVDLGGGIGIRYDDETPLDMHLYALMVRDTFGELGVHVVLEPGRSIVGNAGVLLSRVVQVKKGTSKKFAILDAAMNDLIRPALYDAYHKIVPCRQGGKKATYDIVGPVCETGDTFLVDEEMGEVKAGDIVAILSAGAYGAVMSSNYNTRPFAPEVLVRAKTAALIRKPQTVEDLLRAEAIPAWL